MRHQLNKKYQIKHKLKTITGQTFREDGPWLIHPKLFKLYYSFRNHFERRLVVCYIPQYIDKYKAYFSNRQ